MRTSGFADATVSILQVRLGKLSQGRWLGAKCWVWRIMCAALHICTASFGVWGRFQYLQKSETAHQSRSRCHQFTHFSRVTPQYALLWSYSFSWTSTGEERWKHWQRIRGTCAGSWSVQRGGAPVVHVCEPVVTQKGVMLVYCLSLKSFPFWFDTMSFAFVLHVDVPQNMPFMPLSQETSHGDESTDSRISVVEPDSW